MSLKEEYPLVIIGGGPAGLTASIYASRYRVDHLIAAVSIGGSANEAHRVENWPGINQISGTELMQNMWNHAKVYTPDFYSSDVKKITKEDQGFEIHLTDQKVKTKAIVFAGGTEYRRLSVPGESDFLGRGVSYCATCDGGFFKGKTVAVIGGANSAIMAAVELSQNCEKIYLIYRGEELKGETIWIEKVKNNEKIITLPLTNLLKIEGGNKVERVILDKEYQGKTDLALDGVFIEIGTSPMARLVENLGVDLDDKGAIKINNFGETSLKGFFAAGDVTNGSGGFRQIITASAEGAVAARGVFEYLKGNKFI